eukprot:gene29563-36835_t
MGCYRECSYHTDRVFSVFYMLPNLCSLLLLVKLVAQHVLPYTRVMGGFLLFLCALLSVPVAHALEESGHLSKPGSFALICFGCLLNGVADGMVQALLGGTACSGVVISVLRVITKGSLSDTKEGVRQSAHLYFIIAAIVIAVWHYMKRNAEEQEHLDPGSSSQ